MLTIEEINNILPNLPTKRLRFEVIAEELFMNGVEAQKLVIAPQKSSSRFFDRDVTGIEELDPFHRGKWWKLNTPNSGFYDYLPERLFNKPVSRARNEAQWEEIKAEETQQEADARQLLWPFDNALSHQKVKAAQFENHTLFGTDKQFLHEILIIFWPQIEALRLSENQKVRFFQLTIMAHKISSNITWMQEAFSFMLEDKVQIELNNSMFDLAVDDEFACLGDSFLGVNTVLVPKRLSKKGKLIFKISQIEDETTTLKGLSYERMNKYFPHQQGEKLFKTLCDLLVPVEFEVEMQLIRGPESKGFKLGQEAVLGFTTNL